MTSKPLFLTLLLLLQIPCLGDQPIMNMMPRWNGGYGYQVRSDFQHKADLIQGRKVVGAGFSEDIARLHLEGVYTWHRSIRLTAKIPYVVDAKREKLGLGGTKSVERSSGLGDITLALPLKKYFNLDGFSGSWTFAPQLRVPTRGKSSDYDVYDRRWGVGISLGYEVETSTSFFAASMGGWSFEKEAKDELSADIDLGWNFRDNAQLLWETDFKWKDDNSQTLSAGPALYWRFTDEIHSRLEWKHDFVSKIGGSHASYGNGDRISAGVGFVF